MKAVIILLATWLLGITICFGLFVHELVLVKEQAVNYPTLKGRGLKELEANRNWID